jgi:hypothetical protein
MARKGEKKYTVAQIIARAQQYQHISDWQLGDRASYSAARRYNCFEAATAHMTLKPIPGSKRQWTKEAVIACAQHYDTRIEWSLQDKRSYDAASRYGWLKEASQYLLPIRNRWTKEAVCQEAQKYKTRKEWQNNSKGSYLKAVKSGWMAEAAAHMPKFDGGWTKERVIAASKPFSSKNDWYLQDPNSYKAACRYGWIDEITKDWVSGGNTSHKERILLERIQQIYPKAHNARFGRVKKGTFGQQYELDVYVPEVRKGIEFNGEYFHSPEGLRRARPKWPEDMIQNYHALKRAFFERLGIPYLEISEAEWEKSRRACVKKCLKFLTPEETH